ncbi:hypothetical protein DUNSADRAFT_10749 [Dunaliella salina]|uniref:Uncharacterized protein n=1 Tax=Dunaliella salina TaxID=3046 RepID=A0ABQ7GEK5_DUNSA|nr:hypothetical protein DUNSADRAFT_10749 [Dunaliella salina]|eukprot:KAF5833043.1 hypothetical protein DUNSADRAFT_10749 [Dunaliella salina]
MNVQTHDEQGKGHGSNFAWRQPVKPEQLAGARHGLGAAQGNGVGMAFCKSDWHQHHQLSAPHYHVSSKDYSPGAPNHWAMVWERVGTQAGAAAAAAAAAARGRLGQWARLRREARGGGILLPQEVEALGRQYSCLEHEFQGFKQKWPELDKEAANRRARRRAHSVQPPSASSHLAHAQGTTGGRTPSRSQRDPSRPRTAPSTTQTHAASRSASTSRAHSNVRPGARTPERPPLSNPMLRSSGNSSKLPARGTARTPERRTHSPLPSPSAARLQQQRNPSRDRTMPNAQHNAHLLPVAQQQQQQQQQHSSRLPLSSPRTARTPERSQPPPFSTHIALNHAQPPTALRPITPSSQHRTPEHSRPLFQTSKLREGAGTGHEALALLTPLPSQRHELPQQQQQQQRQQLLRHEQGNTQRRRPGDAADTTAATPARLPHTEAAKADVKQQQRREATSSATAAGACTPPNAFTWQLEGGTPAYSPFGHPLQVGDIGDDDEDPFSMPPSFIGGRVSAAPDGRNSDSSAMQDTLLPHGPASSSSAGTPGQRPMRQSSELLLPSLGSLSAMLAATSHPNTPRDNIPQQHHHQPKTHGIPMQLPPQQQQQQQLQLQLLQQQPHSQHARLMQRRLVQEQRRREMLLEQQHGHAPTSHTSAPTNTTTTATTHPAAAPHTLTLRAPSAPHAPHASTFHLHQHSPTSPPTASALPDGSARAASEPTYLTSPHQGGQANHYGSSSNSNSNRAAADPTTPSPKLPGSASGSCSKAGKEERPSGGSGRARVLAIAAALSEAGSPAARRAHSSPPHLPSPSSSPQLAPARRGAGNSPAAAAAGARGASNLHHLEGAIEGRRKTAPAATTAGAAAAAAGAVEGSRRARQAGKAGGWAPAKSSSSSSGSSTGSTGRTSHAPPSSKTRTNATTPRTAKSSAQAPAPSSISRRSPAALPSSRIAVPRTPTAPPSTFSAAAAAATAIPSSATTPASDSRKPTSSRSGTNSTTRQQRQHTPVHTKTSVGHLTNQHPPSHLTRPLHPSIHSDPAAAALAAAAASLSTARRRSGLSSKTTSAGGSPDSAAGSSAYNSPSPSISGDPPASRPRTRVQRGGDTSSGPITPAAHDTSPRQKHQPLGSPFFVTPASRTTSTLGRDDDDATSRRDSGGGSGNSNAALPKRSSSARMRRAVAASPTDPPAFLASPLSCSPSTHTARYSDASATTTPEFTTTTTTFGSRVQQHKARRLTAPIMRSLPPNIPHGVRGSDGNAGIRKWGCYTDGPSSSQLALHDPAEEDLLPLMQLSTVRSMRQTRMSAASSARSSTAAGGGSTSHTTPNAFASPPSHSPLRKSRASDSIALQRRHPNLQHPRHASVTFLLPPTPTSGGGPAPSSSQDKPLTSSTSPNPTPTQRPAFRLSNSSPLSYSTGARQRSQLSSPSPSISTSLAGSPPRGGSGPGGSGRLGGVVRGSRSGGGTRPSPPPACTPHPFTALQSKSFTGGGAARQATAAAAAEIHSHPPHTASQPQLQPTSRTLFDSSSCAVLDEDADVELVSRGGSSSSHQSGKGNPLARGSSRDGLTRNARGPEARPPARQSSSGSHAHPLQQQHSVGVCAPATTTNPPNNATSSTATAAKGLGGGLASYWSRLFSRAPTQHPSPPQPHPANMVGETA